MTSLVKQAVQHSMPNRVSSTPFIMGVGNILSKGLRIFRWIRICGNRENFVPLSLGGILSATLGKIPTIKTIASVVFGSVSILRCVEDILEIHSLSQKIKRIFLQKQYVLLKGEKWNVPKQVDRSPSSVVHSLWKKQMRKIHLKLFFKTLWEIFKRMCKLALHLTDAYSAYSEKNHVAEVFVHAKDLWKKLSSNRSVLIKHLKKSESVSDFMLNKKGSTLKSSFLVKSLLLLNTVKNKLPTIDEMANDLQKTFSKEPSFKECISILKEQYFSYLNQCQSSLSPPISIIPLLEEKYPNLLNTDKNKELRFYPSLNRKGIDYTDVLNPVLIK